MMPFGCDSECHKWRNTSGCSEELWRMSDPDTAQRQYPLPVCVALEAAAALRQHHEIPSEFPAQPLCLKYELSLYPSVCM